VFSLSKEGIDSVGEEHAELEKNLLPVVNSPDPFTYNLHKNSPFRALEKNKTLAKITPVAL
jgi:hypothetical protein